jgi:phosphatidate cytidylyltransferase
VTRGDLARRVGTAAVGLPLLALALFWAPPLVLILVVAAASSVGLWEFYGLVRARGIEPLRATGFVLAVLFFLQIVRPALVPPAVLPIAAMVVLAVMLTRAGDVPGSVTSAAVTLLGAAYLGGLGGTLAALRLAPYELGGPWVTMLLLTTVMTADSAALFVGSAIGRHKLAPRISPGKTWEGLAGALVGGVAGALVIRQLRLPWLPLGHAVALAVAVALAGTGGDLVESLLKRWAGVKDSGALFPGHGGMLDRLDSLLFGAPVLYYYLLYAR